MKQYKAPCTTKEHFILLSGRGELWGLCMEAHGGCRTPLLHMWIQFV